MGETRIVTMIKTKISFRPAVGNGGGVPTPRGFTQDALWSVTVTEEYGPDRAICPRTEAVRGYWLRP